MHDTSPPAPSDRDDEYTLWIVKYGTRTAMRHELFLNYGLYGEPDGSASMDYFFWIARNRLRTIVIDTGFSTEAGDIRGRTMLIHPREALAALGVDPRTAETVILTHAHYDHVGNNALFPTSALSRPARDRLLDRPAGVETPVRRVRRPDRYRRPDRCSTARAPARIPRIHQPRTGNRGSRAWRTHPGHERGLGADQ